MPRHLTSLQFVSPRTGKVHIFEEPMQYFGRLRASRAPTDKSEGTVVGRTWGHAAQWPLEVIEAYMLSSQGSCVILRRGPVLLPQFFSQVRSLASSSKFSYQTMQWTALTV